MPLAFDSLSHGTVAFGFFNIDSDMLLLEQYFFFATAFCEYVSKVSDQEGDGSFKMSWEVYQIKDPEDMGDLMGAIHGIRHTGFIGELYCRFPFPGKPQDFKQRPDGIKNQAIVEDIIEEYARRMEIPFGIEEVVREVAIGQYRFTWSAFQELIRYVWQGGYPRWKDEKRPDYVMDMKMRIGLGGKKVFKGLVLE